MSVYTGYRRSLASRERASLQGAKRLMRLREPAALGELADHRPPPATVEFARTPVAECERLLGSVSITGDIKTLIVCAKDLFLVPMDRVVRVEVRKLLKARGPGGSWLELVCATSESRTGEATIDLASAGRPDALDGIATRLGALVERPVEIGEAQQNA